MLKVTQTPCFIRRQEIHDAILLQLTETAIIKAFVRQPFLPRNFKRQTTSTLGCGRLTGLDPPVLGRRFAGGWLRRAVGLDYGDQGPRHGPGQECEGGSCVSSSRYYQATEHGATHR